METIALTLKLILLFAGCAIVFIIFWWIYGDIKEKRADNEQTYNIMYQNIQCIVRNWPVNETSYNKIVMYFMQLKACKHKNKEKYTVLWSEFCDKYQEVSGNVLNTKL